jgi:YidC/Oxa1 family membrane protein insertase
MIMLGMPFAFVPFVFSFPAGLLVYWITTNLWTIGQQRAIRRIMGAPKLPAAAEDAPHLGPIAAAKAAITGEEPKPKPQPQAAAGRTKAPPPPPKRKRKRSGKRR